MEERREREEEEEVVGALVSESALQENKNTTRAPTRAHTLTHTGYHFAVVGVEGACVCMGGGVQSLEPETQQHTAAAPPPVDRTADRTEPRLRRELLPVLALGFIDVPVGAATHFATFIFEQILHSLALGRQLGLEVVIHSRP